MVIRMEAENRMAIVTAKKSRKIIMDIHMMEVTLMIMDTIMDTAMDIRTKVLILKS